MRVNLEEAFQGNFLRKVSHSSQILYQTCKIVEVAYFKLHEFGGKLHSLFKQFLQRIHN